MILGIESVVDAHEVEPGRFYLAYNYNEEPTLFQCVRMGETEDARELRAVEFSPGGEHPLALKLINDHGPIVALPQVHIRVDAPSMFASNFTSSIRPGMLLVAGGEAFVAASNSFRGWTLINISTGRLVAGGFSKNWIAFARWLLVIDDNQEEISIASFGEPASEG